MENIERNLTEEQKQYAKRWRKKKIKQNRKDWKNRSLIRMFQDKVKKWDKKKP